MENTTKKRMYIVSFGDSKKYRLPFEDAQGAGAAQWPTPLNIVEKELNDYLREKFPEQAFAYYTTPKVEEVDWESRADYDSYPLLDSDAIRDIKKVLVTEVEDMQSLRDLNSNAPYSDVNSQAS